MPFLAFLRRLTTSERWLVLLPTVWIALALLHNLLGLEFESWRVNKSISVAFWVTPIVLLILTLQARRFQFRWAVIVLGALLAIVSLVPGSCALLDVASTPGVRTDPAFEPILHQSVGSSEIVLYRTDCGAVCASGLVLRQERQVVPGIRIVRTLADWYPADSAKLTVLSPRLLHLELPPYGSRRLTPIVQDVPVRSSLLLP